MSFESVAPPPYIKELGWVSKGQQASIETICPCSHFSRVSKEEMAPTEAWSSMPALTSESVSVVAASDGEQVRVVSAPYEISFDRISDLHVSKSLCDLSSVFPNVTRCITTGLGGLVRQRSESGWRC
jgi:hypothetical protein